MLVRPVGAVTPFTTCPHCSVLVNGTCEECVPGDPHPSCVDCVQGKHQPPWYKKDLFQTILISVTVAVATGIIVSQIERKLRLKK